MIFNKKLDLIEWSQYLEDLTLSRGDINYNEKSYPFVEEVYQAGTLEVSEGDIPVFYLKLTQTKMNTRVKISQFIQHIIPNNFDYTSALAFIEYSDESYQGQYRFSYVKIDRDYNQTTGKYETIRSNPRRYTFVLGEGLPTHTPNQQLKANAFRSIPSIEEAFSVEPVNKEFYKAIQEHFDNIIASVSSTLNSQDAKQFALRFLGRMLFCWFLREKELIPRNLLKSSEVKNKYYRSTLESLFFDVLNQAYGTRTKLLDHEKEIPFLNGGLFTPQDDDHKGKILIDDEIIKNLFETFELYNFTVDESTPSNIEMSIDPEMLGRVFENLLAEIDENTGDSARKSTGSFYTPREIVDYMVVESLKQYFKNNLKLDDDLLDFMFNSIEEASSNPELSKKTEEILNAIHKIKILDPACGSGAFPMGILQRMFILIERIDPEHKYYKKTLLNSIPDEYARRKFEEYAKNEQFDYAYKMKILKDCIYGVDIQESATEISRLRAFLSLIVEEKIDDTQDNRGIELLPNLQFQFITANSLVGLDMELDTDTLEGTQLNYFISQIQEISKETFSASTPKEKQQLENRFEALMEELQKNNWIEDKDKQLLSSYHPFKNSSCEFFEPHIQFGIDKNKNFDIVIANPPYIDAETMTVLGLEDQRKYITTNYKYISGNWDIYMAFFEKGLSVSKNILCFITPDKWLSKKFGIKFREECMIPKMNKIIHVGSKIFESATVDAIISLFVDKSCMLDTYIYDSKKQIIHKNTINKITIKSPYLIDSLFSDNHYLIEKIESKQDLPLRDFAECENACATSDAYNLQPFVKDNADYTTDMYKLINTGTIGKYYHKWGKKELTYLGTKIISPVVNKSEFHNNFGKSYVRKAKNPKIIFKGLNLLDVLIDFNGDILPGKSTLVICSNIPNILKFLCGILNSKLTIFYIKAKYTSSSYCGGITFSRDMINALPIPKIEDIAQQPIIKLVDQILELKKDDPVADTSALESQIDTLVYDLYELTDDEIAIVENTNNA